LKSAGYLDKQSKLVSVKFGSMHSSSSLFSFVKIDFKMNAAGTFHENAIEMQSIRLEPYVLSSNSGDRVLLALEVCDSNYMYVRVTLFLISSFVDPVYDLARKVLCRFHLDCLAKRV
jgi:hypothetical protein